jgi:hypothetical protein
LRETTMTNKADASAPTPSESEPVKTGGPAGVGEDDNSTEKEGNDSHLHEDQKSKVR